MDSPQTGELAKFTLVTPGYSDTFFGLIAEGRINREDMRYFSLFKRAFGVP